MGWLKSFRNYFWILIFPLSLVWAVVAWGRRRFYPEGGRYRSRLPILGIGNVHSGGSGKTPLVLEIASRLSASPVAIVSRGYGGTLSRTGGLLDREDEEGPSKYGDEPWMLSRRVSSPIFVGRNRVKTVRMLEQRAEAPLVILDDGFQHLRLARDVDVVAIQTRKTLAESWCLPLGELREPLGALSSAHLAVLVHDEADASYLEWKIFLATRFPRLAVFGARKRVEGVWEGDGRAEVPSGVRWGGFCGLASPEGFRKELETFPGSRFLNAYPDHHRYTSSDIDALLSAKREGAVDLLVTTDKDWPKAAPLVKARGERLFSLRIRYELSDDFWYFLKHRLEPKCSLSLS